MYWRSLVSTSLLMKPLSGGVCTTNLVPRKSAPNRNEKLKPRMEWGPNCSNSTWELFLKCKYFCHCFAQITNTTAEMCFILTGGQEMSVQAGADGTIRIAWWATPCSALQCIAVSSVALKCKHNCKSYETPISFTPY